MALLLRSKDLFKEELPEDATKSPRLFILVGEMDGVEDYDPMVLVIDWGDGTKNTIRYYRKVRREGKQRLRLGLSWIVSPWRRL